MNCDVISISIPDYIVVPDNPIATIFRNYRPCFAGSQLSLTSCRPHSRETSNQLLDSGYEGKGRPMRVHWGIA
jgi:hypothetical protein